jgi:hypothetical protein
VFVQHTQLAMLGVLADAEDLAGVLALLPLATGLIPQVQLLVTKTVSRAPEEYRVDTAMTLALRQLADVGLHLHPGERVRYLIRYAKASTPAERERSASGLRSMPAVRAAASHGGLTWVVPASQSREAHLRW